MARQKRKQMKVNEETFEGLLQETYNDSHNIRAAITALFTKWEAKIKEDGNIAAFGKEVVSLINAMSRNQDQKITLLKILGDIVYKAKKEGSDTSSSSSTDGETLSDDYKAQLLQMIEDQTLKGNK